MEPRTEGWEEEEGGLLLSDSDNGEATGVNKKEMEEKDPILVVIGDFGRYQLYVCLIGFFITVPHCWVSLSLKFVGMRTGYACTDFNSTLPEFSLNGSCAGVDGRACQEFTFDQSEFRSTIVERWSLVCEKEGYDSVAQSVFFAGCLLGVFLAGVLADMLGRKPVFMGLLIMFITTGVLGGLVRSFYTWLLLRFLLGAASIGMVTVRFIIQVEMLGSVYRTWGNTLGALGWSTGYMLLPVIAYIVPDMAHMEIFIALCGVPFLSLYWLIPESPKWLVSVGRKREAEVILERICGWNRIPYKGLDVPHTPEKIKDTIEVKAGLLSLIKFPSLRRNLLCMGLTWFCVGMTYFGIALHTPEFGSNVYMVFFLGGLIEIPTNLAGPYLMNMFGRKRVLMTGFTVTSFCLFSSGFIPHGLFYKEWVTVTLITLGKVGIGVAFECVYIWTSEIFPTVIRNSSLSLCSSCARMGAIIAPLIVEIDKDNPLAPILVYGMVSVGAVLISSLIYPETKDCENLPNSLEDGEHMCSKKNKLVPPPIR